MLLRTPDCSGSVGLTVAAGSVSSCRILTKLLRRPSQTDPLQLICIIALRWSGTLPQLRFGLVRYLCLCITTHVYIRLIFERCWVLRRMRERACYCFVLET